MSRELQGVLPIVHTPFTEDDEIDEAALAREVDYAFAVGAQGLGTGMVSELLRLTSDERYRLTTMLVESAAGRGPVFAGVSAESTRQSIDFARDAVRAGCDAVMSAPPLSARLDAVALVEHFRALAEAVDLPLIVQDASGYVGQTIPHGVYVQLLERFGADKILFKPEASPIGPNVSALRDATQGRARIFEGSGGIHLVDSFRRGIAGTMPGVDLLEGVVALWRALQRGADSDVYRLSFPVSAIVALQLQAGLDGFLAIEKHLLVKRGIFSSAQRRKPYGWELDHETAAEVDLLMERLEAALQVSRRSD
ncbi:MAG: dihydrodipicolinate synthase family protein [Planctomycetales bacterium]|nr:dihydrodipicolinate synthase family protein [Planctomycetales bacterium]